MATEKKSVLTSFGRVDIDVPGEKLIPVYARTNLTDKLYKKFNFQTDYEIPSKIVHYVSKAISLLTPCSIQIIHELTTLIQVVNS